MKIEMIERVTRSVALIVGLILLTLGLVRTTWWGLLGIMPLVIAFSGW